MEIVVTGRHTDVPARLRAYAQEKLAKVDKLCPKAIRVDVEFTRERNPRLSGACDRIELTCMSRGPAIRAEAAADDATAAFDLAWEKLESRLRRVADRRRVHRGARSSPAKATRETTRDAAAGSASAPADGALDDTETQRIAEAYERSVPDDGPMIVREKRHPARPMTLDQALYEMELVGHDFFLFIDKESTLASVVYRRRGYDYGVIRLVDPDTDGATARDIDRAGNQDHGDGTGPHEFLRSTAG